MRKKILLIMTFLIGVLTSFSTAKALTNISFKEVNNGMIKTTIHFEEGFVGGIDFVLKVNGNVNIESFAFDSKIANGSNTTYYSYDKNNKTLTVRITTGGIGTGHNLLNVNKELVLGDIVLSTTSSSNVKYTLNKSSLKFIDNSWNSIKVSDDHLTIKGDNEFNFMVNKKENEPAKDDENKNTNTNITTNVTTNDNNSPAKTESEKTDKKANTNANNDENSTASDNKETDKTKNDISNEELDKTDSTKENDDKDITSSNEEPVVWEEYDEGNKWLISIGIATCGIILAGGIFFLIKRKNKN